MAGPSIARFRMQEFRSDATVHAEAARHVRHIRAHLLAQIRYFIDERDLRREETVGRVFDQFGRLPVGPENGDVTKAQRSVELREHLPGQVGLDTEDHAVGTQEVLDRGTLAKELGIRGDVEILTGDEIGAFVEHDCLDPSRGSDGNGRLGDDQRQAAWHQNAGDLPHSGLERAKIRLPGSRLPRGSNRQKHDAGIRGVSDVFAEGQPCRAPWNGALSSGYESHPTQFSLRLVAAGTGYGGNDML